MSHSIQWYNLYKRREMSVKWKSHGTTETESDGVRERKKLNINDER